MSKIINKELMKKVGVALLNNIREVNYEKMQCALYDERYNGIIKTILSLKEVDVENEKIVSILQKHWNLRLSEAKEFVNVYYE